MITAALCISGVIIIVASPFIVGYTVTELNK